MRNFYLRLQLVAEERHSFYTPRQLWNHYLYLYILPNSVLPFVEILPGSNRIPMELLQNYFYGQLFSYSFIWGFSFVDTSKLCGYRCPLFVF